MIRFSRHTFIIQCVALSLFSARVAGADVGMDGTVRRIQGQWKGTINVISEAIIDSCEHSKRSYHLDLTLKIGGVENPHSMLDNSRNILAKGKLTIDKPIQETEPACDSPEAPHLIVTLKTPTASVQSVGTYAEDIVIFNDWLGAPDKPYLAMLNGQEDVDAESQSYRFPFKFQSIAVDQFSIFEKISTADALRAAGFKGTPDPGNSLTTTVTGSFRRIGAAPKDLAVPEAEGTNNKSNIAKLLAALLAYLALLIPGMILNPRSSDFISLLGTLVGSLEALKGLGLGALAGQARIGGFAGGALAEAFELARIYQASTGAGESAGRTATRLAISAIPDIAAFAASAVATEAAIGVAMTAAPMIGVVAAGAVAVGGAALITYGISAATTATKTWATGLLNSVIGK